ncbi:MAG TPA: O-antigen ligase family protein [Candidatus Binatia bacterium]|jgi:O-antigen ligase
MEKFRTWWERGLITALCLSVAMLGVGRMEFEGGRMSAWSISRTTFFFWLALKLFLLVRGGWAATGLSTLRSLAPLLLFFTAVTLSLLPDFHQAGDYRYFFFGCAHAVMLVDLFSAARQRRWLPWLLGLLPLILVARGFVHDPSVLDFDLSHRFKFPLDSWNTAGYVLAMSIPLCLLVTIVNAGWWRALGLLSCAGQMLALILTFSRGAWLGWTASMVYLGFTMKKWKYLAALAVLATTCVLVAPALRNRLVTISQPQSDQSIRERLQLLKSSLQLGMENPVLGVGYGRGRLKESLRSRLEGTVLEDSPIWHTHNVYVELFAGTGLLGLLSFLWLIGQTLLRVSQAAIRRNGAERLVGFGIAASWVAAIVTGVGDIPFYHHETRIFFFSLFALACIYSSRPESIASDVKDT